MPPEPDPFDPLPLLEALARGDVEFVVIGGIAGGTYGSAFGTFDLELVYARDRGNLERLAAVLRDLGARLRGAPADLPFQLDAKTLENEANFRFATRHGDLDVLAEPAGAPPYAALEAAAKRVAIRGVEVRVASLDHLIAMKEAAGRPKDRLMATEYRGISDLLRAPREE